jgi:DNA/RNA endonuclease YhcR with UshA esterase domain
MRYAGCLAVLVFGYGVANAQAPAISASDAAKSVGKHVTVEMVVQSVGRSKGVFFLNSDSNYRSPENFTLFISRTGAASFKRAGISDPAAHFDGKTVRATGTVKLYKGRPEIVIEEPTQISVAGTR